MIDANDLLIGSLVFVSVYILVRLWLSKKKPEPFQQEIKDILTSDKYKVKGRFESRIDQVE